VVVDLAGGGALEAAHDVELGQALVGPPLDLGPGRWVAAHPDQGDAPQGVVGPAVTAPISAGGGGWGPRTPGWGRRRISGPRAPTRIIAGRPYLYTLKASPAGGNDTIGNGRVSPPFTPG
jgi:hypothetical protein